MGWKTKHKKSQKLQCPPRCQQSAHLAVEQKHTYTQTQCKLLNTITGKKTRHTDSIVDQNIHVRAGTKNTGTWTGAAHASQDKSRLHNEKESRGDEDGSFHALWPGLHWQIWWKLEAKYLAKLGSPICFGLKEVGDLRPTRIPYFFLFASVACFGSADGVTVEIRLLSHY